MRSFLQEHDFSEVAGESQGAGGSGEGCGYVKHETKKGALA